MFGRDTSTPKPGTLFQLRLLRITSIDQVHSSTEIPELGTEEPYHERYVWCINPENTITIEDIAALYRYKSGEDFTYHTSSVLGARTPGKDF